MTTLTKSEKISLDIKDIAKSIKKQLKQEFPGCKFSVSIERYAEGQALTIALMSAPRTALLHGRAYAQINQYALSGSWDDTVLTQETRYILVRVKEIADYYNYDNSDSMSDYYDVNFSFHLEVGKWDKPFEVIS